MKKTAIGALIICIMALVSAGCGSEQAVTFGTIGTETENVSQAEQANEGGKPTSVPDDTRGVWIASVSNIDFPSKPGLSADELRAQLDGIVETVCSRGLNTIFFQVRPASDALYRSEIFPVSAYLTGTQGAPLPDGFDPLDYIIEAAHDRNIAVVAWINPYRITSSAAEGANDLCESNPARIHPDWTVEYAGKLYYNPGIPEVRELVVSGVREIAENYDVDGVHMDDYFYPYPVSEQADGETVKAVFDDSDALECYNDGSLELSDWRRENVNKLVKACYRAVKQADENKHFGISPFGIWANSSHNKEGSKTSGLESYYEIYCDPLAWIEGGYVDYICPQLYWSFETKAAPFGELCDWWNKKLEGTGVKLLVGHAAYRVSEFGADEIIKQLDYAAAEPTYSGSVFYGYADISADTDGLGDAVRQYYEKDGNNK